MTKTKEQLVDNLSEVKCTILGAESILQLAKVGAATPEQLEQHIAFLQRAYKVVCEISQEIGE